MVLLGVKILSGWISNSTKVIYPCIVSDNFMITIGLIKIRKTVNTQKVFKNKKKNSSSEIEVSSLSALNLLPFSHENPRDFNTTLILQRNESPRLLGADVGIFKPEPAGVNY